MPTDRTIAVLPQGVHGLPPERYVAALRERLDEWTVELVPAGPGDEEPLASAPVVTGRSITEAQLATAASIELFAGISAGTDHLPLSTCRERGVTVTNASGVHGPNIAEHVIGWLLTFARRLDEGWRRQQRREWRRYQSFGELNGSTVTVVGLGAIGRATVERLDGFGVETTGVRYSPEKGGPTDEVIGFDPEPLFDALARTDYLVLACPLTDTTRGLIDADAIATLPVDAVVVNVARGGVIETDALVGALRSNELRGAGLDVTDPEPLPADHPLWTLENVLLTPHCSGHTPQYFERCAEILERNLARVAATGAYSDLDNQIVP